MSRLKKQKREKQNAKQLLRKERKEKEVAGEVGHVDFILLMYSIINVYTLFLVISSFLSIMILDNFTFIYNLLSHTRNNILDIINI